MMNSKLDKIQLNLAGERVSFLYNRDSKEVYNPLFPGIAIYKYPTNCGHILSHDQLREIVEGKINEFELAIAKMELNKAVQDFKDYSEYF